LVIPRVVICLAFFLVCGTLQDVLVISWFQESCLCGNLNGYIRV